MSHWCQEIEPEINPSKVEALWCILNNTESTNSLRYLGIHFDKMFLTYKMQVESTKLRCKKGLSALKAITSKGIEQRHLFLLHQSVMLSVINYGLGLTALSQSTLDRVQNEAMRVIWEQQRTHPLKPCATYRTCHTWKQGITWIKSKRVSVRCRIPRIISTMLSKKKRAVDCQEASHG